MKFLELFAGISGIGWGLTQAGMKCVGYVEWDKYAHLAYRILHDPEERMWSAYDIRSVTDDDIRSLGRERGHISLIAAGFPCQSFSIAGKREGFADATRGTLFFEVIRFASILRPDIILLENVDGLRNHDGGRTLGIILSTLEEMGYLGGEWQVLNSAGWVPQNRERIFIVASLGGRCVGKILPFRDKNESIGIKLVGTVKTRDDSIGQRDGIHDTTGIVGALTATDYKQPKLIMGKDKRIRKLTPLECFRLQSYPDWWYVRLKLFRHPEYIEQVDMTSNDITEQVLTIIRHNRLKEGISDSQLYKMAGNGVTSIVAYEIGVRLLGKGENCAEG